jgi:hypothetical protein
MSLTQPRDRARDKRRSRAKQMQMDPRAVVRRPPAERLEEVDPGHALGFSRCSEKFGAPNDRLAVRDD